MSVNVKIDTSGGSNQTNSNNSSSSNHFNPCNLIVNYLPQSVKEHDFNRMFANIGPLKSCKLMFDRNTGYSFGYGFVEYVNEQDAKVAIESLNGLQIDHKRLKVAYARPNCEDTKNTNLYIRNIPVNYDEQQLADLFSKFGQVVQARILRDQNTTFSRRIGFVIMGTKQMAQTAIQNLDNVIPPNGANEPIFVKYADEDGNKRRHMPPPPSQQFHNGRNNQNFHNYQNQFQNNFQMMQSQPNVINGAQLNQGKIKSNRNSVHQNRYNPIGGANQMLNGLNSAVNALNASGTSNGFNAWNATMNPMQQQQQQQQQQGYSNFGNPNSILPNSAFDSLIGGGGNNNNANMMNNAGYAHPNMHMHPSMQQHSSNFMNGAMAVNSASLLDSSVVNMDGKMNAGYGHTPTSTIYVYGIGPHATESDLFSLFSNCGRVQRVNVIKNARTGQSRGFGFVVFDTFEEASFAVHSMNGFNFNNRSLQVSFRSNETSVNFVSSNSISGSPNKLINKKKNFHKVNS